LFGKIIDGLSHDGDLELACVRAHANADGSLSEQINKKTGFMTSAADLTWNYASMLTALQARDALAGARISAAAVKTK
jgi:glucoamylase